ncbi:EAL domain-containing protein [Methylobacterium trifolii]|uniref:EAL domain-containing protein n=1 Tax=Methylobacterium trifolii TaxID=1003092 RepID=A0ABQ4U580_9HYPH|nr:EAL domain-containing protein [Methylobacterium trifolii]GJE62594.1 hypothetical protein MPOCJGCO_4727 [Methylobacterium trifolii]
MVRVFGRHASLLALALLGVVVLAPLAVFLPLAGALALAAAAALGTLLAHGRSAGLKARCDKLSQEVDLLSKRLLKAEASASAPPRLDPGHATVRVDVEELTVEIGLLSGIVRDLTAVVTAQDGEIARLKHLAEAAPPPPEPALPVPVAPVPIPVPIPMPAPAPPRIAAPDRPAPEPVAKLSAVERPEPAAPMARPIPPRPVVPPRARPETIRDEAMVAAFEGEGLEVHLQPVVSLPQRKVTSYEALARLRIEDVVLAPETFLPALERHGRTTELDRRMLRRVATIARHLAGRGSDAAVTYGLSPLSLFEPGFLRGLARLVADEPALNGRLVVALPQASWRSLDAEQANALQALRGRIGFILDRPTDLRFDAAALAARGVGQIKVPAELLLRPGQARRTLSDIAIEDLVAALARVSIRLGATAVEAEADVPDLIDLDVPFAQGTVFAAPRPVRADVLAAPPSETPPESEEPPEPPPQKRPFRSFLRRAG